MELRKGPLVVGTEIVPHFLEISTADPEEKSRRLGDDGNLLPGYESILSTGPGYQLVDLLNPWCDESLGIILKTLATAPGVETVPTRE